MIFPENFDLALMLYENKFFQLNNRRISLTKQNFDQVIRNNKFEFLAFIEFYTPIKKETTGELKTIVEKLVNDCYYSKFNTEISLKEMMTPQGYSHDLSDEPVYKTSILY